MARSNATNTRAPAVDKVSIAMVRVHARLDLEGDRIGCRQITFKIASVVRLAG
jgi:hypothetical protein